MNSIVLYAEDKVTANKLSAECKNGTLKRIYHGIYSPNIDIPTDDIVQKNWIEIISYIVPNAILSHRSAIDLQLIPYGNSKIVFITSTYNKSINLPGLVIKVIKGDNVNFTERFHPKMLRSNEPRALLENLSQTRKYNVSKAIGVIGVETRLAKILHNRSEKELNKICDDAKIVAEKLNLQKEFKTLNLIISSLLSTNSYEYLSTKYAKSIVKKQPYDINRINLFTELSLFLQKCSFINRPYNYDRISFKNISFFESYFSNYIEGTRFIIDEAEDIIFSGETVYNRHADSHDVLANFNICNDYIDMSHTPSSPDELISLLQSRHAILMAERQDVFPGTFKNKNNMAGNTLFVSSEDVVGTLVQAFDIYKNLQDGMQKALFIHFVLTEVHPFHDGNGRISRIMLNSELVKSNQFKMIIPNVYRESYISALRSVTRDSYFLSYCKTMDIAQAYTASFNWLDYPSARAKIEKDKAEKNEDEGLPIFSREIRKLTLTEFFAK